MLQPCEIPQEVLDADETVIGNVHAFCSVVERGLFWHMWDVFCVRKRSHWICKSTVKSQLVFWSSRS